MQVVCGAPNAKKGLIGVFAGPGTYVPGIKLTLGKASIRGVDSAGMMCSERELELSTEHSGIIELPERMKKHIGERFVRRDGAERPVIDIAITPNRPDCLGVRGVARDLAAAGLGKLKKVSDGYAGEGKFDLPIAIELSFPKGAGNACPIFAGPPDPRREKRAHRRTGCSAACAPSGSGRSTPPSMSPTTSPMTARARSTSTTPISCTARSWRGSARRAKASLGLDGKTYEVDETMCVIADKARVLGLGGVMGGEASGSTEATT